MKKFDVKNILIPVDFSDTSLLALDHAAYMAKLFNASITLLHVNETLLYTTAVSDVYPDVATENKAIESSATQLNNLAGKMLQSTGISCKVKVVDGDVSEGIIEASNEIAADVIIMGTHGTSGVKEFLMGSNVYSVVSGASCPVISIQTHVTNMGFKNIVMPIDDSLMSRQKVNHAVIMAEKYGSTIHIAGLVSDEDPIAMGKFEVKIEQVENFLKDRNIDYTTNMIPAGDNIAQAALNFANGIHSDLIVVMSEQNPDLTSFFMGPFAKQLVNHSKIPIMAIQPDRELEQSYTFPYWT
jgi:nucleotide-binding universal stress UspA family protein